MAQQDELKVHVKINSRYPIFDQSGSLPFSIVFGLCRRSRQDTNTGFLILDTSASVFDVPYALANGLLKLSQGQDETEVDLGSVTAETGPHRYISLPPLVRRAARWNEDFEICLCEIDCRSDLARLLKPDTKYTIRLASTDLGVQWWRYNDSREIPHHETFPSAGIFKASKLVNSQESAGKAAFKTRDSLPTPPDLDVRLRLQSRPLLPSQTITDNDGSRGLACTLEVSITNSNSQNPVSVQSTGHQRFLIAWGPFQPVQALNGRERLTSLRSTSRSELGKQNFIIRSISADSNNIVYRRTSPLCGGLVNAPMDRRPTRSDFTTLLPGKPVLQTFDLDDLLVAGLKLSDGEYAIGLESQGTWWCWGHLGEIFNDDVEGRERVEEDKDKEKIPEKMYKKEIPPVWLRSKDEVFVRIVDGRVSAR